MDRRILPALLTLIGLPICAPARVKSLPGGYFAAECFQDKLTVFPLGKSPIIIPLPPGLICGNFRPDGKAIYAFQPRERIAVLRQEPSEVFEIRFNPTRVIEMPGWKTLLRLGRASDYAVSQSEEHIVFSGQLRDSPQRSCGIFDLDVIGGKIRRVMENSRCDWKSAWRELSLSPSGEQMVATHYGRLELIDLVHGTSRSLGELERPAWSPDGKWIAAVEWRRRKLILIDSVSLSQRRLPGYCLEPKWSPDSKYILLFKYHLFRCGFSLDLEGPATLVTVEIATRKKSTIRSSECRIQGATGWISEEIITR